MPTGVNNFELHWKNDVIYVKALFIPIKKSHEIREVLIPKVIENKLEKINKLVFDGLMEYGSGSHKFKLSGKVTFSPDLEIRFPDRVKSKVKLIDFETVQ